MIEYKSQIDTLRRTAAKAWRSKHDVRLSELVEAHVRLSPTWEANRGKYDLTQNPFWRDILDAMTDPEVRQISICKSTRVGGTLLLIAAMLGISEVAPGPAMVVTPDEPSCIELRDRIYDTARESARFRHRVPPQKFWNTRSIDLLSMRCYMAWAGSAQRLRGRTCQRVFRSEIDVYPRAVRGGGDPLKASAERVKRSFYSLVYSESSPDGDNSAIYKLWSQGNQMRWYCPCPHCGKYQELRFFTYKAGERAGCGGIGGYRRSDSDATDAFLPLSDAMANAHYICINGCRIDNDHKVPMVSQGVWVPKGCDVTSDGIVTGTPERSRRHISAHLWSIHVPTLTFASIVEGYINHYNENMLREFWQNWLGLRYRTGRRVLPYEELGRRFAGTHSRGQVPSECWFLTAGVDVQLHGVYYVVWAWADASRMFLVDWGYIKRFAGGDDESFEDVTDLSHGEIATDIDQIHRAVLNRKFRTVDNSPNPIGLTDIAVKLCCIDSNYRKNAVHRYLYQRRSERLRAVRGDHGVKPKDRFRQGTVDKSRDGETYEQERKYWAVASAHYKEDIFSRYQFAEIPVAGPAIVWPKEILAEGNHFLRQMANDRPTEATLPDGSSKVVWTMDNNKLGRDYFHATAYAFAAAEMILQELKLTWDSAQWATADAPVKQQESVAAR